MIQARELFESDQTQTGFPIWLAAADPTQFLDTTLAKKDADDPMAATLNVGPMVLDGIWDADGSLKSADMQMGPLQMNMERVYVDGSPW